MVSFPGVWLTGSSERAVESEKAVRYGVGGDGHGRCSCEGYAEGVEKLHRLMVHSCREYQQRGECECGLHDS